MPVAVDIALDLADRLHADPVIPEIHCGIAYGPTASVGGDVFGPAANLAAAPHDDRAVQEPSSFPAPQSISSQTETTSRSSASDGRSTSRASATRGSSQSGDESAAESCFERGASCRFPDVGRYSAMRSVSRRGLRRAQTENETAPARRRAGDGRACGVGEGVDQIVAWARISVGAAMARSLLLSGCDGSDEHAMHDRGEYLGADRGSVQHAVQRAERGRGTRPTTAVTQQRVGRSGRRAGSARRTSPPGHRPFEHRHLQHQPAAALGGRAANRLDVGPERRPRAPPRSRRGRRGGRRSGRHSCRCGTGWRAAAGRCGHDRAGRAGPQGCHPRRARRRPPVQLRVEQ